MIETKKMNTEELKKNDYTIIHKGEGKFDCVFEGGEVKNAGPNLCGMIRYTYFEDYTIPPIGWNVKHSQLIIDYFPKATRDIIDGKLKPNQMNY